ncbi:hypothetical protein SAMN05660776_0806 [Salegentibacter holothuriorum]|uniref:Thrombospondin type 3 repeat-containing protein n=1 Tax=Salegentibacter holothuriorum TaxID=241145 RepID=A0A1T5ARV6_9FLAO|nr:thrombospondin type 3 repeat-containing protein [Salegentibacter holothuriorum]SKB37547.1 hypothetical protein SAMN05660776_0806 [Salegentibacter holothuriorum]
MKILKRYMAFIAVFSLLLSSCTKEDNTITDDPTNDNFAEISLGATLNDFVNKAEIKQSIPECSEDAPAYAHVELTHNMGTPLEGTIEINVPIMEDDGAFYTAYDEGLKIPIAGGEETASVSLTTFLVYDGDPDDDSSSVIWAAPASTSDYGNFVNQGLPFDFMIRAGSKKYVDVEVLCFDDREVILYGYQFFDLKPEILHEVCIFANYCDENGRHFTANYSLEVIYTGGSEDKVLYESMPLPEDHYGYDDDSEDYYADPFCFAVPAPMEGEMMGEEYIRIIATLSNWDDNYPEPADKEIIRDLTWTQITEKVQNDGTLDYFHLFFNCEEGDSGNGNGEECDPQDANDDCDNDGVPNGEDVCNGFDDNLDLDKDGVPDGCDSDIDGDGIPNDDENVGCVRNPDPECGETVIDPCLPQAQDGCEATDVLNINLETAGPLVTNESYGDWTIQIVNGELFVGLTPIIPFEISDIEVTVLQSATCEVVSAPDEGGSVTISGITEDDLPLSIDLRANICDVSGE